MQLAAVVDRLTATCPVFKGRVLLALSGQKPTLFPAAFVLPLEDKAGTNALLGAHSQRVTARFGVEIMVKHAADTKTGGPAAETLEIVRAAVLAALKGWTPDPSFEPFDFAAGRLLDFDAGMAVWRDEFTTRFYI